MARGRARRRAVLDHRSARGFHDPANALCDPRADGARSAQSPSSAQWAGDRARREGCPRRRAHPDPTWRVHPRRRPHSRRRIGDRRERGDRRVDARRARRRSACIRGHAQRQWSSGRRDNEGLPGQHGQPDHPSGRAGTGPKGALADVGRALRPRLQPGGTRRIRTLGLASQARARLTGARKQGSSGWAHGGSGSSSKRSFR